MTGICTAVRERVLVDDHLDRITNEADGSQRQGDQSPMLSERGHHEKSRTKEIAKGRLGVY